jgi:class 3 adenylate cyclase
VHRTGDLGYFVRVESIVNQTAGLTIRVVVIIPGSDFLGDISSGSRVSIIATACAIVALIMVSAIIIVVQMHPLHELHERLLSATDFTENYDGSDADFSGSTTSDGAHSHHQSLSRKQSAPALSVSATQWKRLVPSRLVEIYKIQTAYVSLHRELRKVKSFLPQSVLRQLEQQSIRINEDGEEGREEELIPRDGGALTHIEELVTARQIQQNSTSNEMLLVSGGSVTPSGGAVSAVPASGSGRAQDARTTMMTPTSAEGFASSGVAQSSSSSTGLHNPLAPQPQARVLTTWAGVGASAPSVGNGGMGASHLSESSGGVSLQSTGDLSPRHQSSQSKRRSGVRKGTTVAMLARPSISIEIPLQTRRVTVLVGNVNRFHTLLDVVGAQVLQRCHAIVVDHILSAVNRFKGVLDSFFGDHFMVTFNSSVACSRPAIRATRLISDASTMLLHAAAEYGDGSTVPRSTALGNCDHEVTHHQTSREGGTQSSARSIAAAAQAPWSLRIGCATGSAICGNFGSDRMRRFCAVGPVVSHANALMQQCRSEGCASAVESQTFQDAAHECSMEHVNFVVLPHAAQGGLISTVLDRQLLPRGERGAGGDGGPSQQRLEVTRLINEAFEAFARGDLVAARDLASRVPREHAGGIIKCLRSVMQSLSALSM